jgi:hypothetical protein
MPSARMGLTMVTDALGLRLLVFGGWNGSEHLSDLHVLDFQKWHWQHIALDGSWPSSRTDHVAGAWRHGMVIHGGCSDRGELADLWLLHWQGPIASWYWERLGENSNAPGARCKHTATIAGDNLVVAGGERGGVPLVDVHTFDLKSKSWASLPHLPYPIACQQCLIPSSNGIAVATYRNNMGDGWTVHSLPWYSLGNSNLLESTGTTRVNAKKQVKSNSVSWKASEPLSLQHVQEQASAGDHKAKKALASIENLAEEKRSQARWAMLHRMANMSGREEYIDPASGYVVFTASFLRKRPCCGNGCRHCPYGHINVPKSGLETVVQDW